MEEICQTVAAAGHFGGLEIGVEIEVGLFDGRIWGSLECALL
jgi:hypothetical protein